MKKHKSKKVSIDKNQNQKGKNASKNLKNQIDSRLNQHLTNQGKPITLTGSKQAKRKQNVIRPK